MHMGLGFTPWDFTFHRYLTHSIHSIHTFIWRALCIILNVLISLLYQWYHIWSYSENIESSRFVDRDTMELVAPVNWKAKCIFHVKEMLFTTYHCQHTYIHNLDIDMNLFQNKRSEACSVIPNYMKLHDSFSSFCTFCIKLYFSRITRKNHIPHQGIKSTAQQKLRQLHCWRTGAIAAVAFDIEMISIHLHADSYLLHKAAMFSLYRYINSLSDAYMRQ